VYAAAAVFFVLTILSYVEGASLHQERGGATVIARYAFNELWSFVAGWAILFDYLILIALTAFVAVNHLSVFWGELGEGALEFGGAAAIIAVVAWINFRGLDPRRFERFFLFALADLAVQVVLLILGLMVLFDPQVITAPASIAGGVSLGDLVFSFTLAVVAFTALDASSGFAGQVAVSRRGLRKLLTARVASMAVSYIGLALVASSTLGGAHGPRSTPETPVIGVVEAFEQEAVRDVMRYLVAASAFAVLFTACVGAMLGLSKLGYSLAVNRQIPSALGRLHPDHATPFVLIGLGAALALVLMAPKDMELLGAIYAFGATLAFTIVHLGVLRLRKREPDRDRPFRIPFNVLVRGVSVPLPAVAGALVSAAAFVGVLVQHNGARIVGPIWMAFGITLYVVYRRSQGKPLYHRVTVPEKTLTRREEPAGEYGTILVPVLGTALDDDIMQTAGRLAADEGTDDDEEGAQIEAMWVFELPMSLALDSRLPEGDLKRARDALSHAKAVGEEYEGVTVNPFTVRSRSAGEAIVREARRRGVEAIVMPAEEPTRVRGGVLLGGKEGMRDTFVGETTRYVVNKAGCRVVLTAPPDPLKRRALDMAVGQRPGAPPRAGDPMRPIRRAAERLRPVRNRSDA
jgi:APA family basic amino acid/polyamine antiporter